MYHLRSRRPSLPARPGGAPSTASAGVAALTFPP